ncbi:sulfatase family protein [Cyclobacterium jeungdonense]|uniref:Arylsulfatase n=1 Tax=Cyclobacterium jeungdonense TaxID=708087 RepID=A0ABT8CFI1_9BACT|nr:arylsulfatase [Cyclobacterium jeungdonense]MDN3690704.1 arylsulfatase [Cyclobacterium jeungdonense]
MTRYYLVSTLLVSFLIVAFFGCKSEKSDETTLTKKPNIVIIYMDDLGYGDMSAYEAGTLETPNMDFLANQGMKFTKAYAASATCTPSRYALLTGTYPWRNKDAKILPGTAPLLIGTEELTIPKMLKQQGYTTAVVGKWHLGLGSGNVNWNDQVSPGPNEVGFDYSYIMAATQDRVPTVYLENGLVQGLEPDDPIEISYSENFEGEPTGKDNPELLTMNWHHGHNNSIVNGIPRIGFMKGGEKARWVDEDMADHFLEKAKEYVKEEREAPFFLYYAFQQPHVPRTPHPRFAGKSGMGPRGDVILEADWCIGQFMETLEAEGLLENTLVIFSSDNGPVLNDGYYDDAVEKLGDHTPWGPFRGGKYSLFEAGTRLPFVTYWKGTIEPGQSDAMISQIDILNSLAALTGSSERSADGQNFIDTFLGQADQGRESLVLEATSRTAFRQGDWVLIPPYKGPAVNTQVNIELGNDSDFQLYDLSKDKGQQQNLADQHPEKVKAMLEDFVAIRGEEFVNTEALELK